MKTFCTTVFFILHLLGCSTSSVKGPSESSQGNPEWVSTPSAGCRAIKEICFVGEGGERERAKSRAMLDVAQFFETQVSAQTVSETQFDQSQRDDVLVSGSLSENVQQQVKEVVDKVLVQGVQFQKFHRQGQTHYALAVLDRLGASTILKERMQVLDEQMEAWLKAKRSRYFRSLRSHYLLRNKLNEYYVTLNRRSLPKRVSYDDILALTRPEGPRQQVWLDLKGEQGKAFQAFRSLVEKALVDQNYKLMASKEEGAFHIIGKVNFDKAHLKVKGFEKYRFQFDLSAYEKDGHKRGSLLIELDQVGRNFRHAFDQAYEKISKVLLEEDKILELELI